MTEGELKARPFVSATAGGEYCHCGEAAVRKVGEEIPIDDPIPLRHNLTAYVCARHYAELMGPLGAEQVGYTRTPTATPSDEVVERAARAIDAEIRQQSNGDWPIRMDGDELDLVDCYLDLKRIAIAALSAIEGEKK